MSEVNGDHRPDRVASIRVLVARRLALGGVLVVFLCPIIWNLYAPKKSDGVERPIVPTPGRDIAAHLIATAGRNSLLREPKVQKDLDLSMEQVARLDTLFQDGGRRLGDQLRKMADKAKADAERGITPNPNVMKNLKEDAYLQQDRTVRTVLTTAQYDRLGQIAFQAQCMSVHLMNRQFTSQLKLTNEQQVNIETIASRTNSQKDLIVQARQEILAASSEASLVNSKEDDESESFMSKDDILKIKELNEKLKAIELSTESMVLNILTDEQKMNYGKQCGKRFDFDELNN